MYHPFFSNTNPAATNDVFVAKLNATGAAVWLQQFGTGNDIPWGTSFASALVYVATDAQNHAYVAGTTTRAFPNFTNPNKVNMLFVTQFAPVKGRGTEENQACGRSCGPEVFCELIAWKRYPAFSSKVTERSRF